MTSVTLSLKAERQSARMSKNQMTA